MRRASQNIAQYRISQTIPSKAGRTTAFRVARRNSRAVGWVELKTRTLRAEKLARTIDPISTYGSSETLYRASAAGVKPSIIAVVVQRPMSSRFDLSDSAGHASRCWGAARL